MKRYTGFKLLIVDDHEHNLFTLRTLIERHMDVQVFEADSRPAGDRHRAA